MTKQYKLLFILAILIGISSSCSKEDDLKYEKREIAPSTDPIDVFLQENFLDKYNCAIRWRWDDKFVSTDYYVTPTMREIVIPVAKMIEWFWVDPYKQTSKGGEDFIVKNFPPEIVFIGSDILNANGTTTLGFAEAGVRITLSELDNYDLKNIEWLKGQLHTIHHEFTHIVHQQYKLPAGYEKITGSYSGNSWVSLYEDDAIMMGCVTPYGTNNEFEDFCELISTFLISEKDAFAEKFTSKTEEEIEALINAEIAKYTTPEAIADFVELELLKTKVEAQQAAYEKALADGLVGMDAVKVAILAGKEAVAEREKTVQADAITVAAKKGLVVAEQFNKINLGKKLIDKKLAMAMEYYKDNFDIELTVLRDIIQKRIADAQK